MSPPKYLAALGREGCASHYSSKSASDWSKDLLNFLNQELKVNVLNRDHVLGSFDPASLLHIIHFI